MASRLGPARPRGSTANGAGAWLIFSQSRQVNFSRTICTTFHCRGTTSSRSVTSSPSLASLCEPQQPQALGPGTITRSRGRCAGNGLRADLRRVKARTCVVSLLAASACSAATSSSVRRFELLELKLHLVDEPRLALVARSKQVALELLDHQPKMHDQRFRARRLSPCLGKLSVACQQQPL